MWFAERGLNHHIAGSRKRSDIESGQPGCPRTFPLLTWGAHVPGTPCILGK